MRPDAAETTSQFQEEGECPAPEGGWGWIVVATIAVSRMSGWSLLSLAAVVYRDVFIQVKGAEGSSVTFVVGLFLLSSEITGIVFPFLNRKFSLRATSITGGVMFGVGSAISVFAVSVPHLAFSYGFVQGVGNGLILSSTLTAFNQYFRRRRTTAMATAMLATSALTLGLPHAVQAAVDADGARGGRLVFVGVSAVVAAAQLLVRTPPAAPPAAPPAPEGLALRQLPLLADGDEQVLTAILQMFLSRCAPTFTDSDSLKAL